MTKEEARQAMLEGKKVRHLYYSWDEWIEYKDSKIQDENGYWMGSWSGEFWAKIQRWENGWEIVND